MPRRPLAEITGNRALDYKLSPYLRGKIERSRKLGQLNKAIRLDMKIAPLIVQSIINRNPRRNEGVTLLYSSRPKKYTERDKRQIIYFI
jgi:hypothetical protein